MKKNLSSVDVDFFAEATQAKKYSCVIILHALSDGSSLFPPQQLMVMVQKNNNAKESFPRFTAASGEYYLDQTMVS